MILLTASDVLQLVTTGSATFDVFACEVEKTDDTHTIARNKLTQIAGGGATTTITNAVTSAKQANGECVRVVNTHASASGTVRPEVYDGVTTVRIYPTVTLLFGEAMVLGTDGTLTVYTNSGVPKKDARTGTYLRTVYVVNGTTTYTTSPDCNGICARGQAGGGAGGGGASAASSGAAGGGGSAGGYWEKYFAVSPSTGYTCAVGAGGTAGSAGNNAGNDGGATTLAVGATTATANGGKGGTGMAATNGVNTALGGASPAVSTNGDLNSGGGPGNPGILLSNAKGASGNGGSGTAGVGATGRITHGTGATASVGFGGGGAGGLVLSAGGNVAGGAGANGVLVIDEYA